MLVAVFSAGTVVVATPLAVGVVLACAVPLEETGGIVGK